MTARRRDGASTEGSRPRIPPGRRRRREGAGIGLATPAGDASTSSAGPDTSRRKRKPRFVL